MSMKAPQSSYFQESFQLITNPGMGFKTMQRFNGDPPGYTRQWTEGFPVEDYPPVTAGEVHPDFVPTSMMYWRVNWRFLEPEEERYNWALLDNVLATARARGQTVYLRVAPYSQLDPCHLNPHNLSADVPDYVRAAVGPYSPKKGIHLDHNHPKFVQAFSRFLWALAARYNGHPDIECVDISVCGSWGEGSGTEELTEENFAALHDPYVLGFDKSLLVVQACHPQPVAYCAARHAHVGWRVDCWGDYGPYWCHMRDAYPDAYFQHGVKDLWKSGPVSIEAGGVLKGWFDAQRDINDAIDNALRWHINNFNNKSGIIPREWRSEIDYWRLKMGYRLVPRKIIHSGEVIQGDRFFYEGWWTNAGVAPPYQQYPFLFRFIREGSGGKGVHYAKTDYDVRTLLPGDDWMSGSVALPADMPPGTYRVCMGFYDRPGSINEDKPGIRMAIRGGYGAMWVPLAKTVIQKPE